MQPNTHIADRLKTDALADQKLLSKMIFDVDNKYRTDLARHLSTEELWRLRRVLRQFEGQPGQDLVGICAVRLIALSGLQSSDLVTLKWDGINFHRGVLELGDHSGL